MYYNEKTNQLMTSPPWGSSYIDDEIKAQRYKDWQVVANDFKPPEKESIAGSITHTITTNAQSEDTITIQKKKLTAGSDFDVGNDADTTAGNIVSALEKTTLGKLFSLTASGDKITVTEKIAGGGNTPTAATTTGSIKITSSEPINSVAGYETTQKRIKLDALDAESAKYAEQYIRSAALIDLNAGLTSGQKAAEKAKIAAAKTAFDASILAKQEVIING